jgi:predicted AAA+ superfamily ATPase
MDKEDILRVLTEWNFWGKGLETGIPRKQYVTRAREFLDSNMVVAVMGVRRAGKSFIVRQLARELISTGVSPGNILYVNLEAREFADPDLDLLDKIEQTYLEHLNPSGERYVLIDEVHLVKGWERWVRTRQELGRCRLVITGSNSDLLRGDLATSLTGRHLDITVLPLGLQELLTFRGLDVPDLRKLVRNRTEVNRLFREYMEFGGFPLVALSAAKKEILGSYFDDIISKDIVARHHPREIGKLTKLAVFCLTSISCPMTYRSLERASDLSINTLEKFSRYYENAMMLLFVGRFAWSFKERNKSPRKVYSIDTGLCNIAGFRSSENTGRLAENIVALELFRKKIADTSMELYYWKDDTGHEVDFVVKRGKRVSELIQVCWDLSDPDTKKREVRALAGAMEALDIDTGLILNEDFEREEKVAGRKIVYRSLVKWLLDIR